MTLDDIPCPIRPDGFMGMMLQSTLIFERFSP